MEKDMKVTAPVLACLAALVWIAPAYADYPIHTRHVEWRLVEPCDIEVASGELTLEWGDFSGDYEEVVIDSEYGKPIRILFYAGCPDYQKLEWSWYFCGCGWDDWQPDIYCGDCCPWDWYKYYTEVEYCCDVVCIRGCLPCCTVLEITDLW